MPWRRATLLTSGWVVCGGGRRCGCSWAAFLQNYSGSVDACDAKPDMGDDIETELS
jgi:hypothetical protein